jgi:hypothetical protein
LVPAWVATIRMICALGTSPLGMSGAVTTYSVASVSRGNIDSSR